MTLKEIQERNYKATVKRKLITGRTDSSDFIKKIYEELTELDEVCTMNQINDPSELADIIITCLCMAYHFNVDIDEELKQKTLYNEKRND